MNQFDVELSVVAGVLAHPDIAMEALDAISGDSMSNSLLCAVFSQIREIADEGRLPDREVVIAKLVASGVARELGDQGMADIQKPRSKAQTREAIQSMANLTRAGRALQLLDGAMADIRKSPMDIDVLWASFLDDATFGMRTSMDGKMHNATDLMHEALAEMEARSRGEIPEVSWPIGIRQFDDRFKMAPNTLIVLGAASGGGKTTMACYLSRQILSTYRDAGVIHFSFADQTAPDLAVRHLSGFTKVESWLINKDRANSRTMDTVRSWIDGNADDFDGRLALLEDHSTLVEDVVHTCRRARARMGAKGIRLRMVVLDYAGSMHSREGKRLKRPDELKVISRILKKQVAKALGVTVVLCAQLNRGYKSARPPRLPLSIDLAESSQMEYHADMVFLLHRFKKLEWAEGKEPRPHEWQRRLCKIMLCCVKQRGPEEFNLPLIADQQTAIYWPYGDCGEHYPPPPPKAKK